MHPDVDAAVLETARGGILREGLGFDRCQVAVVTNIGAGDHLGLNYITTVEDLAVLKRVIVQNVARRAMRCSTPPTRMRGDGPHLPGRRHLLRGGPPPPGAGHPPRPGPAQRLRGRGCIVAAEGNWRETVALADIPLTRNGAIGFQVENAMAAVAAAWGAGLSWDAIRAGLASFVNDADNAPGRFNVMDYRGATVIADYGHNPDAMRALVQAVEACRASAARWSSPAPATAATRTSASRPRSWARPSTT
jgi:cyanophycin synthetase